ncbi:hypothetical protein [Rothia sp. HMSC067H10]|uniref:hypothetical protein n=1 Tax=Rothia sp. HMSC067H10 TaxID=1739260 RepID=UPI001FEE0894|nr:hypothetical protein [Rothia sp. HMSC067H10]
MKSTKSPGLTVLPTILTAEGERVLDQATGRICDVEQHMVGGLSDAKRQELWDLLTICIEGLHAGGSKT